MARDYYAVLSLEPSATGAQVRERFLALAKTRHPDLFSGDDKASAEEEFQAITEAFNVLSNPERRRQHDLEISKPESGQHAAASPEALAKVYIRRGVRCFNDYEYFEAASNFDRATRTDPKNAQAWYNLALACMQDARWLSRAMTAISKACELDRLNVDYLKLAGRLFARGDMPLRAERYYQQALRWSAGDDPEISDELRRLKKA